MVVMVLSRAGSGSGQGVLLRPRQRHQHRPRRDRVQVKAHPRTHSHGQRSAARRGACTDSGVGRVGATDGGGGVGREAVDAAALEGGGAYADPWGAGGAPYLGPTDPLTFDQAQWATQILVTSPPPAPRVRVGMLARAARGLLTGREGEGCMGGASKRREESEKGRAGAAGGAQGYSCSGAGFNYQGAHTHAHMHTCTYTHMHTHTHAHHMHTHTRAHMHTCTHVHHMHMRGFETGAVDRVHTHTRARLCVRRCRPGPPLASPPNTPRKGRVPRRDRTVTL